jgi:hypothetical protein
MGLVSLDDELLSECALNMGEGHGTAKETHVQAMILLTQLAKATRAAGTRRRDGNALTHSEVFDVCAQGVNNA